METYWESEFGGGGDGEWRRKGGLKDEECGSSNSHYALYLQLPIIPKLKLKTVSDFSYTERAGERASEYFSPDIVGGWLLTSF